MRKCCSLNVGLVESAASLKEKAEDDLAGHPLIESLVLEVAERRGL